MQVDRALLTMWAFDPGAALSGGIGHDVMLELFIIFLLLT